VVEWKSSDATQQCATAVSVGKCSAVKPRKGRSASPRGPRPPAPSAGRSPGRCGAPVRPHPFSNRGRQSAGATSPAPPAAHPRRPQERPRGPTRSGPGQWRQTNAGMGVEPPGRLHGGERARQRGGLVKPCGPRMGRRPVRHDEWMIPPLQPRLRPGKIRNIPIAIGQGLGK
jgi:hypothetical protein